MTTIQRIAAADMLAGSGPLIQIGANGELTFVWDDTLASLMEAGPAQVTRVSNVDYDHQRGGWTADMAQAGSADVLGPFVTRSEALAAERAWLRTYRYV